MKIHIIEETVLLTSIDLPILKGLLKPVGYENRVFNIRKFNKTMYGSGMSVVRQNWVKLFKK